jgi:hypothetical protein
MLLMTITGTKQLSVPAGLAFNRAVSAGAPPHVTSAWRDPVYQTFLRAQYLAGVPGYNFALPADESTHCMGLAIDVPGAVGNTATAKGWWAANGTDFGFFPVTNEDWHFEYRADQDPSKPKPQEDDMPERNYFDRSADQPLAGGKWTTIKLNNKGDVSLALGNETVVANVQAEVSGVPVGVNFQIRMYVCDVTKGKTARVKTLARTKDERVGTVGVSPIATSVVTGLTNTQRLRAEIWVPTDVTKAVITNAGGDAAVWN